MDPHKAIEKFKTYKFKYLRDALLTKNNDWTNDVRKVYLGLPEFSLKTLSTPEMLVKYGVWPESALQGWAEM